MIYCKIHYTANVSIVVDIGNVVKFVASNGKHQQRKKIDIFVCQTVTAVKLSY